MRRIIYCYMIFRELKVPSETNLRQFLPANIIDVLKLSEITVKNAKDIFFTVISNSFSTFIIFGKKRLKMVSEGTLRPPWKSPQGALR